VDEKLKKMVDENDWLSISKFQDLSEEFIEENKDLVNWHSISLCQKLSEEFIERYKKRVDWPCISTYQKLSEEFIEKYKDRVNWFGISGYQDLSEWFIEKHKGRVKWCHISSYQKLSEEFIEKHKNRVEWACVSRYQKLSEEFIEEHKDLVKWYLISGYQKLSEEFIEEHKDKLIISVADVNWLYKSNKNKLDYIKNNTNYEVIDKEWVIAYKSCRSDGYSVYNFQYKYEVGKTYESHCDCMGVEDSFGLSAWTKKEALEYHSRGKLLKVKIHISDLGIIVRNGNKIRCRKLTVLEEMEN